MHDLFNLDFFRDHPLGRPICGQSATVLNLHREDFLKFVQDRYLPGRVIVSGAGHLRHEDLVREIEGRLGAVQNEKFKTQNSKSKIEDPPRLRSGVFQHGKPLEQVHLCLGVAGIHQSHPLRYAAYALNTILGGGMSSRLFQEIREKRGRAYSVYSFLASYQDVGYFGVYAGTSLDWTEEVVELTLKEMKQLAAGEVSEQELERTKSQLIGNMILGLETSDSWMSHIAKNEIYFGQPISLEDIAHGVRLVTRSDIIELARSLFRTEGMTLTLLGDFEKKSLTLSLSA